MPAATKQERDELVERHLPLADRIARRFGHTKEPLEDLVQVPRLGLTKAATRWDPARQTEFRAYAVPTMMGELRRHFHDAGWAVRPPRRLQELFLELERTRDQLLQELQREPSADDLAVRIGRDVDSVLEALEAGRGYSARSLDVPFNAGDPDGEPAVDHVADARDEPGRAEDATVVGELCSRLRPIDREFVRLRYDEDLIQAEIANRLDCSQMQVSRRLRAALLQLQTIADAT